jgi:lysozyme family protein
LDFYRSEFWNVLALDFINNQIIATELFDTGVNMGTGVASLFLQKVLNVTNNNAKDYPDIREDAKVGPLTVGYLNTHKRPADVLKLLNCLQGSRYVDIARSRPANENFMHGWLSRVTI